ncbi:MAG: thioredoxin [Methylocystis sp.]|nr:thioredoxin [Methylocystis sp.]MCA3583762.1 thioredoxin [Methylocystis sp.]MCA3586435.1 thioredoxin [Methylocystis sp.]MCA3589964.1 thioredoxin [Methylocystis sp.]
MLDESIAAPPDAGLIKDTTTQGFRQDVMAESMNQPVLVDFWAPWCGPCKALTPVLEKVVKAAKGKVKLVKMNIDEHPQIAGQLGVKSIPAVFAFQKGQPVDGFMGALPESQVKSFIERLIGNVGPSPIDEIIAAAEKSAAEGDFSQAAELYAGALAEDDTSAKAMGGLIRVYVEMDMLEQARQLLNAVKPEMAADAAIAGARAAIEAKEAAASLGDTAGLLAAVEADPANHQARIDLAIALNAKGDKEGATDQLIASIRKDRAWSDGAARKQLLLFFEAWGHSDDATVEGRRKLSAVLFS